VIYFGLTTLECGKAKWLKIQREILGMGFALTDVIRNFTEYPDPGWERRNCQSGRNWDANRPLPGINLLSAVWKLLFNPVHPLRANIPTISSWMTKLGLPPKRRSPSSRKSECSLGFLSRCCTVLLLFLRLDPSFVWFYSRLVARKKTEEFEVEFGKFGFAELFVVSCISLSEEKFRTCITNLSGTFPDLFTPVRRS